MAEDRLKVGHLTSMGSREPGVLSFGNILPTVPVGAVWLMPNATDAPGDKSFMQYAWARSSLSTGQMAEAYDAIVSAARDCGQVAAVRSQRLDEEVAYLDQGCELLDQYAQELKGRGHDSEAAGAEASAYAIRRLALRMLDSASAQAAPANVQPKGTGASEETLLFGIEVEKPLCAELGRQWSAAGISIESLVDELAARPSPAPAHGSWVSAEDVQRLARDLDVAMNGEAGAAPAPQFCDVVAQAVGVMEARRAEFPVVARWTGGAKDGGPRARVWVQFEDGGAEVEFAPAVLQAPAVQYGALIAPTPLTPRQLEVLEFLYGAGPLDGHWFEPDRKPRFWWRTALREAFAVAAAQPPVQGSPS